MLNYGQEVNRQYGRDGLFDQISAALTGAGKDLDQLTRTDLSTFDEFHIGGLPETRNLAGRIPALKSGSEVLDIGSGLGGPARTLAAEYGCEVVGLDLTVEYCDTAEKLTDLVGLSDQVSFKHGDALEMPFADNSFDVVWTQFTGMNIEDKQRLYAECYRVIRSDGFLAFHEVLAGQTPSLIFPVFWADTESVNYLSSPDNIRQELESVGFQQIAWDDMIQYSIDWFKKMSSQAQNPSEKPPVGYSVFVGENTKQKAVNVVKNLQDGHALVVQAVYQAHK